MNLQAIRNKLLSLGKPVPAEQSRVVKLFRAGRAAKGWAGKQTDRLLLLSPIVLAGGLAGMGAANASGSAIGSTARFAGNFARKHPIVAGIGGAAALDLPLARDALSFAAYPVTEPINQVKSLANPQLTPAMQRMLATQPNISEAGPFSGNSRYSWGVRQPTMEVPVEQVAPPAVVKESAMQMPRIQDVLQKTAGVPPLGPPANQAANAAAAEAASAMGRLRNAARGIPAAALAGGVGLAGTILSDKIRSAIKRRSSPGMLGEVFGHGGSFRRALGYGLGAGVIGGGALAATGAYDKITDPYHKEKAFKGMLAMSPGLKGEDSKAVKDSFNVLWKFNKDIAEEPTSAASFVRRSVMFKDEGIQTNDIKTLSEIRKNMGESNKGKRSLLPSTAVELAALAPRGD